MAITSIATGSGLSLGALTGAAVWQAAEGLGLGLLGIGCNVFAILMILFNWKHFEMFDPKAVKETPGVSLKQATVELCGVNDSSRQLLPSIEQGSYVNDGTDNGLFTD